jgi:DNA-binding NarL/FixJ family response regulator
MRVLLADDHALFLDGLHNLLTLHGIQVVGTASNGLEAFEQTLKLRPDIVLMDIRMPECDGVTATRLIKAEWPECKVVMLTTSTEEPDLLEAIQSGASGYLLKSLEIEPFMTYLRGVQLVAQDFSNKEIATKLSVSEHTVKYHLGEIYQRLQVKSRHQAVEYAIRNGLIKVS